MNLFRSYTFPSPGFYCDSVFQIIVTLYFLTSANFVQVTLMKPIFMSEENYKVHSFLGLFVFKAFLLLSTEMVTHLIFTSHRG